jgi:hypothetical protein
MRRWLQFPNPVNEVAARLVATGVVAMCAAILLGAHWVLVPLAYGFVARVLCGPTFSPLGRVVTGVVVPRLHVSPKFVAGPPKRFAQGIGATLSVSALVVWLAGSTTAALVLVAMIIVAASLEAFAAYCLGCKIFAVLMRKGLVPESACAACADISSHLATRATAA